MLIIIKIIKIFIEWESARPRLVVNTAQPYQLLTESECNL
jgi:hypothetical protein